MPFPPRQKVLDLSEPSAKLNSCVVIENNSSSSSSLAPLIGQNGIIYSPNPIPESLPKYDLEPILKSNNEAISEHDVRKHIPEIGTLEHAPEQNILESVPTHVILEPVPERKHTFKDSLEPIPGHGIGPYCQTSYIIRCDHMTSSWTDEGESKALVDICFQINTDVHLLGVVGPVGAGKVGVAWVQGGGGSDAPDWPYQIHLPYHCMTIITFYCNCCNSYKL